MQLVIFEDAGYKNLLPLVYSRGTFNLRCGHDNLLDKIEGAFGCSAAALFVRPSIAAVVAERQRRPVNRMPDGPDQFWINGRLLLRARPDLPEDSAVWCGETLLAARLTRRSANALSGDVLLKPAALRQTLAGLPAAAIQAETARLIEYPWQLVRENAAELLRQSSGRSFTLIGQVYAGAHLLHEAAIHLGAGSKVKPGAVLDAEAGPIWIGENVTISPNASLIGPCYIGDGCVVQAGASIRGATTIGPFSKVGGEIEASIIHGYSNKQHDGFLGHSYVGEWVNLGADTVNSDLKNTYGPVRVAINGRAVDTGLTLVGAIIGDHTKTAIRTALPTGCVIGYACNVAVSRFVPKFVPSFTWLTDEGAKDHDPSRAWAVAKTVAERRNRKLSATEEALFLSVQEEAKRVEDQMTPP
jgi:UDP-N-acetylglucosamine diphosphorylase/glucosamine-1-phosphate N-acetyltransferase